LWSALKEYTHKFSLQTGIRVQLVSNGDDRLEFVPEAEVQLLRIIQEALSNVRKHSGASQAWIRFEPNADTIAVIIEDNGKGFNRSAVSLDNQAHFGLQTMLERAEGVGGSLQVLSQPDQGVKVVVKLPFKSRRE
jgi:signal transduction histidine kinase